MRVSTWAAGSMQTVCAAGYAGPPVPIFHAAPTPEHADIAFPDFSYWGTEGLARMPNLAQPDVDLVGWGQELPAILNYTSNLTLWDRHPEVIWRGRHHTGPRDALR